MVAMTVSCSSKRETVSHKLGHDNKKNCSKDLATKHFFKKSLQ